MELIIAFIAAITAILLLSENESLADYAERQHVNRLADDSKKSRMARNHKYTRAGIQ